MGAKRNKNILLFWSISWILLANLFALYRFVGLNWSEEIFVLSGRQWWILFGQTTFIGLAGGLLFGLLDIYIHNKNYFHRINFGTIVLIKSLGYLVIATLVMFIGFFVAALINEYSANQALHRTLKFYGSGYFLVTMVYLFVNMMLLNFMLQVNDKFGPGNFFRIFLGHYYHPVEEERIFVFIDLRSSTRCAELLGHIKYSQLIQDCFYDITPVVEHFQAEIYQYVGDEIVLSWEANHTEGFRNAALTFFGFQNKIRERKGYYLQKYGLLPEFKAGINAGTVTATEVGIIKKEIAYHGDAINTASRIQEQCNLYDRLVLCSENFIKRLNGLNNFKTELVGEVALKGKQKPVRLYGIEPVADQDLKMNSI